MKKVLAAVVISGVAAATAIPAFAGTHTIRSGDNWYVRDGGRPTVTVRTGSVVTWKFVGSGPHNAVVKSGPQHFRSKVYVHGSYSHTMVRPGKYLIYCTIHGLKDMSMWLKVR